MKPRKGRRIVDAGFKYTPAAATDLRATFARVRAERAAARSARAQESHQPIPLRKVSSG